MLIQQDSEMSFQGEHIVRGNIVVHLHVFFYICILWINNGSEHP